MTISISFEWHPYRYFPYEQRLARREVEVLLGTAPSGDETGLRAELSKHPDASLLSRLTYFREVRVNGSPPLFPIQAQMEASATSRPGLPLSILAGLPSVRRQSTRYSAHGLHEYRGKFHPHIVRAIGNVLALAPGDWIADPFCGSGTTLLEAAHASWNAVGVDRNPLGVFISKTKLGALAVQAKVLRSESDQLADELESLTKGLEFDSPFGPAAVRQLGRSLAKRKLPNQEYLEAWFPPSVLEQLASIDERVSELPSPEVRDIARVVLSDCLRAVSLQEPADLRIRRRKDPQENYPAIPQFVAALRARVATILKAREVLPPTSTTQDAVLGDSRKGLPQSAPHPRAPRLFDGIITSPPYATALPYIDTQRLSLAFLGLSNSTMLGKLEEGLIGAREICARERRAEEHAIAEGSGTLPEDVVRLCRRALALASSTEDGFRRKNVAALLFRYFRDMNAVFASMLPLVRPGGFLAALVGPNKTTLGGQEIEIGTPSLLAAVAESVGWTCQEIAPLDAYQRFDMHRSNSITSEALVVLQRKAMTVRKGRTASRRPPQRPSPGWRT